MKDYPRPEENLETLCCKAVVDKLMLSDEVVKSRGSEENCTNLESGERI